MSLKIKKTRFIYIAILILLTIHYNLGSEGMADGSVLTLQTVFKKVINNNPDLLSLKFNIKSKDGDIYQSSRLPNPEFEFEIENFFGNGDMRGFDQSEITAILSQEIPAGKKRSLSVKIARGEKRHAELRLNQKIADLLLETKKRFYNLYFLQEIMSLKKNRIAKIREFETQIRRRVKEGKNSYVELSRIQIYLLRCETDLMSIDSEYHATGIHLASLWGEDSLIFDKVIAGKYEWDQFDSIEMAPDFSGLNPDLEIFRNEIQLRKTDYKFQKSMRIPDIKISGGMKRHFNSGFNAFTAGVSIPVPIFDSRKGDIASAGYKVNKAVSDLEAEVLRLRTELNKKLNQLKTGLSALKIFREKIIPESVNVSKMITDGYMAGRSDYIEVIDVYESGYEIEEEYIRSIRDCRIEMAEIDRLNGRILQNIGKWSEYGK